MTRNLTRSWALAVGLLMTVTGVAHAQAVTDVPSGDTVVVSGIGKIRLLGIRGTDEDLVRFGRGAAPAVEPPGSSTRSTPAISAGINLTRERPSRRFLQQLVLGKTVVVQYDSLAGDKGGRRAYILLEDGTLVNAEMLRKGRARVDLSRPFAHQQEFQRLEGEARKAGLGIWAGFSSRP